MMMWRANTGEYCFEIETVERADCDLLLDCQSQFVLDT